MIENSSNNPVTMTGTKDHRMLETIIRRIFLFCIILNLTI